MGEMKPSWSPEIAGPELGSECCLLEQQTVDQLLLFDQPVTDVDCELKHDQIIRTNVC